jgi:hypothetical protein
MSANDPAMMCLAPWRSMNRPRKGAIRLPAAVKDSDALICDRFQPKVSCNGSMNSPKPYTPAPTDNAPAKKGAVMTHQPRYIFGLRNFPLIRMVSEYIAIWLWKNKHFRCSLNGRRRVTLRAGFATAILRPPNKTLSF